MIPGKYRPGIIALLLCTGLNSAYALDGITRPYLSVRSTGMGGVRMTTGLYDENFFNNPARVTANPESKFTLVEVAAETNLATATFVPSLLSSSNPLSTALGTLGVPLHARVQFVLPAYYLAPHGFRKYGLAFGITSSFQLDAIVRRNFEADVRAFEDIGLSVTYGRKLLAYDTLSVGITSHVIARGGINAALSLFDLLNGVAINLPSFVSVGSMIDFDLGATYRLFHFRRFDINVGAAVQNILGGAYNNLPVSIPQFSSSTTAQPRSFGGGVSLTREKFLIFKDSVLALEMTDIGNNGVGSIYKLTHLGGETNLGPLALRAGLNQGYWTAGIGFNLKYLTLDATSYGEELGLNAGDREDRRYAVNLGLHIL